MPPPAQQSAADLDTLSAAGFEAATLAVAAIVATVVATTEAAVVASIIMTVVTAIIATIVMVAAIVTTVVAVIAVVVAAALIIATIVALRVGGSDGTDAQRGEGEAGGDQAGEFHDVPFGPEHRVDRGDTVMTRHRS